jgi:NAD-dependent deacetylase
MKKEISLIAQKISEGGKTIVFTGAGISTESGIPRSKGGIWDKFRPEYFDEFMSSKEACIEYWRRKLELYHDLVQAKPNPAHMAISQLYEMGLPQAVITQNIDVLHQESGLLDDKVIELNSSNRRVRCMRCGKSSSIHEAQNI